MADLANEYTTHHSRVVKIVLNCSLDGQLLPVVFKFTDHGLLVTSIDSLASWQRNQDNFLCLPSFLRIWASAIWALATLIFDSGNMIVSEVVAALAFILNNNDNKLPTVISVSLGFELTLHGCNKNSFVAPLSRTLFSKIHSSWVKYHFSEDACSNLQDEIRHLGVNHSRCTLHFPSWALRPLELSPYERWLIFKCLFLSQESITFITSWAMLSSSSTFNSKTWPSSQHIVSPQDTFVKCMNKPILPG